jgi:hypothetical protein
MTRLPNTILNASAVMTANNARSVNEETAENGV